MKLFKDITIKQKLSHFEIPDFVTEMRKRVVKVSLVGQDELEEYFNTNKNELLELDSKIKQTDREIDVMVYELYRLNDDEIRVVENS